MLLYSQTESFFFAMYIIKVKSNSVIHPGDIIPFILVKKDPAVNHVLQ